MKRSYYGKGAWDTILWLCIVVFALWAWVPDFLPAEASEVKALADTAAANPGAKQALIAALKENPNPNRGQLREMRQNINEMLVTATAREVTGDTTLPSPGEAKAAKAAAQAARDAQIAAKSWTEMSNDERAELLVSKWPFVAFGIAMVFMLVFGWRTMASAQRGY